ncbi:hypothetical protein LCGC14_2142800 [marine sediment metagenome]|uniref:Uncharacterized protein n=1 Tax=marine sediment metagenome TaxID=412755 RepID=A0A0F9DY50_9ZZZZ
MRKLLVRILIRLLDWLGYTPDGVPELVMRNAEFAVDQVRHKFGGTSGEHKRAQAFRMLQNLCPDADHRDLGYAIEKCLRR